MSGVAIPLRPSAYQLWLGASFALAAMPLAIILWMLLHSVSFQAAEAFDAVLLKVIPSWANGPIGMFMAFTAPLIWVPLTLIGWKFFGKRGRLALISLPVVILPYIATSLLLMACAHAGTCL